MSSRPASHAGSWYLSNPGRLQQQLQTFCSNATESKGGVVKGAKVIISPHAGYAYCGSTMACSYVKLDLQDVKRIFILGPSHHFYFENRALLTQYETLDTPLGSLDVDCKVVNSLLEKRDLFGSLENEYDEDEHSLEMQFPMLAYSIQAQGRELSSIKVVPMLISHNTPEVDYALGRALKDYLDAGDSAIILSSDFCHWGRRFGYTGYVNGLEDITDAIADGTEIETLTSRSKMDHHSLKIYKSIELLDYHAMEILGQTSGPKDRYQLWKEYLDVTGNTICGEKPIGIFLCTLSHLESYHSFKWVGYSQSSSVISLNDSSVSYAAGYCVL